MTFCPARHICSLFLAASAKPVFGAKSENKGTRWFLGFCRWSSVFLYCPGVLSFCVGQEKNVHYSESSSTGFQEGLAPLRITPWAPNLPRTADRTGNRAIHAAHFFTGRPRMCSQVAIYFDIINTLRSLKENYSIESGQVCQADGKIFFLPEVIRSIIWTPRDLTSYYRAPSIKIQPRTMSLQSDLLPYEPG